MSVRIRAEGSARFAFDLLQSKSVTAGATYEPTEGVEVQHVRSSGRKGVGLPEIMEFLIVDLGGSYAIVKVAEHIWKAGAGRVKLWIEGRRVESEEEVLEALRDALTHDERGEDQG